MTEPNETDGFTARRFLQFLFPFYGRAEMVQPAGAVQRNADCQSQPKAAGHIQHGVLLDEQGGMADEGCQHGNGPPYSRMMPQ